MHRVCSAENFMRGLLVVNGGLLTPKFLEIASLWKQAFARAGIGLDERDNISLATETEDAFRRYDFCLFYDKDVLLCRRIEGAGVRCYNSSRTIAICDDKCATAYALERAGVPVPRHVFSPKLFFGELPERFLRAVGEKLGYPVVVKAAFGSFGEQVALASSPQELLALGGRLGAQSAIFEEYLPHAWDVRVYVVGDRAVSAMKRINGGGEFRSNASLGAALERYDPTEEEARIAVSANRAVGADFSGVDLLGGKVLEVNSNAHFKNLLDLNGFSYADACVAYIKGGTDK